MQDLDTAAVDGCDRIITIASTGRTTANVSMYRRVSDSWLRMYETPGYIGHCGMGKQTEGDGRTPVGLFTAGPAFGTMPDPGCPVRYIQVDESCYWVCDPGSPFYNRMVSTRETTNFAADCSEHLCDQGDAYRYCLNVGYNALCLPGVGSAVFLHCTGRTPYTAGCIAIPEPYMVQTLQRLTGRTRILITTEQRFITY